MIKRNCKQCGKEFILNDSEIKFYKEKNLELPKRCNECRKQNKSKNLNSDEIRHNIKNNNYNNIHKKKTTKNIIIATIVFILLIISKVFNISFEGLSTNIISESKQSNTSFEFRNDQFLEEHFLKHGDEFGYKSKEEYLEGANRVINSAQSIHKEEAEDGDNIYYDKSKNEIVFVSKDGYIRTYFKPSDGIDYFNRQ